MTTTTTIACAMAGEAAPGPAEDAAGRAREIARLNDLCRAGKLRGARIMATRGCIDRFCDPENALSLFSVQAELAARVRGHVFEGGEDPHGERDFGAFDYRGEKLFWKIDYYDPSLTFGSEDPADPAKTVRVLTILLASEY
jgi:hypothetical protein